MGGTSSSQTSHVKSSEDTRFENFINSITDDSSKDAIDKNKFVTSFPPEVRGFADQLVKHVTSKTEVTQRDACHKTFQRIAGFATPSAQVSFYLSLCRSHDGTLEKEECLHLLKAAYYFHCQISSVRYAASPSADEETLTDLVSSITLLGEVARCVEWVDRNCPEIFGRLHLWLIGLITASPPKTDDVHTEDIPSGCILNGVLWWLLSASLPSNYAQPSKSMAPSSEVSQQGIFLWTALYRSSDHGLSINRLQHHVFAYQGPTIFLTSLSDGYCYALAVDTEWREGVSPWGGQNSFLIQISPSYKILEEGEQMVVLNEKSRNLPKGMYIGRDRNKCSLKLTEGLQSAEHGGKTVDVLEVEVWGCGGSRAKDLQREQKNREKRDTEKNAKVKLPGEWDENPDRLLLEWGGVRPSYGDQFKAEFGPDASS